VTAEKLSQDVRTKDGEGNMTNAVNFAWYHVLKLLEAHGFIWKGLAGAALPASWLSLDGVCDHD
jgi:hypothetical protein